MYGEIYLNILNWSNKSNYKTLGMEIEIFRNCTIVRYVICFNKYFIY